MSSRSEHPNNAEWEAAADAAVDALGEACARGGPFMFGRTLVGGTKMDAAPPGVSHFAISTAEGMITIQNAEQCAEFFHITLERAREAWAEFDRRQVTIFEIPGWHFASPETNEEQLARLQRALGVKAKGPTDAR